MRNFLSICLICFFSIGLIFNNAEAKRFGGGKSFGVSRQVSQFSRPSNGGLANNAINSASKSATGNKWLGPLAGLAMGGLLASLFMGHGIGTGILSWLALGGLLFLIWSFIRRRLQPSMRTNNQNMQYQSLNPGNAQDFSKTYGNSTSNSNVDERIAQFDEASFLRNAKSAFIRLQAAYDSANLTDMREFLSPEIFAEIQLQIQERGDSTNQTDVININAELLDITTEPHMLIASVLFSGSIREDANSEPNEIKEIWHFHKFDVKPNWLVAGIQQA